MSLLLAVGPLMQQGAEAPSFDVESDIGWHSLGWADSSVNSGYSDTNDVTTFYNSTAEVDWTSQDDAPVFDDSVASLNNRAALTFDGSDDWLYGEWAGGDVSQDYSIVCVADLLSTANGYLFDGTSSGRRHAFGTSAGGWRLFSGTILDFGTAATGPKLFVAHFNGASSSVEFDGAEQSSGDAGTHASRGSAIGAQYNGGGGRNCNMHLALIGFYEGDVTAHENWSAFESWVSSYYGITMS